MIKFTRADRLAAALAVEAGESLASVSRRFGISESVVRRSLRLYQEHGAAGFR